MEKQLTLTELALLLDISRAITSTLDLDEILHAVHDWLAQLIPYNVGGIYFYNSATKEIHLHSSRGIREDTAHHFTRNVNNNFLIQKQIETGKGWRSTDIWTLDQIKSTPYYREVLEPAGILYGIGAPILVDGEFVGAIHLTRPEEARDFTMRDLHLLELVANQVGVAVRNALIHRQTANLANRYKILTQITKEVMPTLKLDRVLQVIAENMEKLLDADLFFLALLNPDQQMAYFKTASLSSYRQTPRTVGLSVLFKDFPLLEKVYTSRTHQLAHFDDAAGDDFVRRMGLKSLLGVPVLDGGKVIAIIMLGQTRHKRYFNEEEMEVCLEAAEILANLLKTVKIHTRTRRELQHKINRLIEMEEQVKRSQRLAALGEMAAMIAHEVKNPLSSMNFSLFSLENRLAKGMDISGDISALREAFQRLDRITRDLLTFSADSTLNLAPTQLNRVLRRSVDEIRFQANPGVVIDESYGADLPLVMADADRLQEVFTNILLNALAAVEEGGTVRVSTSARRTVVTVAIEDNGPGIAPEHLKKIFNPFFTTRSQGTGLGLPIARKTVEAHRGCIRVHSRPGKGSRFEVSLPAVRGGKRVGPPAADDRG